MQGVAPAPLITMSSSRSYSASTADTESGEGRLECWNYGKRNQVYFTHDSDARERMKEDHKAEIAEAEFGNWVKG